MMAARMPPVPSQLLDYDDAEVYLELWCAVILQALSDIHGRSGRRGTRGRRCRDRWCEEAREWFRSPVFERIAELLDIDHDRIRQIALGDELPPEFNHKLASLRGEDQQNTRRHHGRSESRSIISTSCARSAA